jgi:hypothetical protein
MVTEIVNAQSIPKLLRAIADGGHANPAEHDMILLEAAKLIERLKGNLVECEKYLLALQGGVESPEGEPMYLCNMIKETLYGPGGF